MTKRDKLRRNKRNADNIRMTDPHDFDGKPLPPVTPASAYEGMEVSQQTDEPRTHRIMPSSAGSIRGWDLVRYGIIQHGAMKGFGFGGLTASVCGFIIGSLLFLLSSAAATQASPIGMVPAVLAALLGLVMAVWSVVLGVQSVTLIVRGIRQVWHAWQPS